MADEKNNKKIRIIMMVIVGVLTLYSIVMWVLNYRTLEQALATTQSVVEGQAKNFRYYVHAYHTTKTALDVANQKVVDLTTELQAANLELTSTRSELSSVQAINDQLKQGIESLEKYKAKALAKGEALETMINAFKKKNRQMDLDLQVVRKELSTFQPDVFDAKEGTDKIVRFKNQIRLVKKNMGMLKEQALMMKRAAQEQHDRLESLYGNNGYLMKDGKDQSTKRQGAKVDIKVEFK